MRRDAGRYLWRSTHQQTKQINHYENTVLVMAKARGDRYWEASTNNHLDRLKNRRADRCPDYRRQRSMLIAAKAIVVSVRNLCRVIIPGFSVLGLVACGV